MRFTAKMDDFDVACDIHGQDALPVFRCEEALYGKTFSSVEAIEAALRAYKLGLRKDFRNATAFRVPYGGTLPTTVTVTSITEDGREAWIKNLGGGREKVSLSSLFADKQELVMTIEMERRLKTEISAAWAACRRWQPEFTKNEKEG